jgi:hypothetical protein
MVFRGTKHQCSYVFYVPHESIKLAIRHKADKAQHGKTASEALEEETYTTPDFVFLGSCIRLGKKDLIGVSSEGPRPEKITLRKHK